MISIPSGAMGALKKSERAKGAAEVRAELDKEAQARGFADHKAMLAHLDRLRSTAPARPAKPTEQPPGSEQRPTPPTNRNDPKAMRKYQHDLDTWKRRADESATALKQEQQRRRRAERERDAAQARASLERIASAQGIVGAKLGQAIYLFEQHLQGKTVEQIEKIDEAEFFKGLRKTDPYLFGEVTVPANTGTSGGPPGAPMARPPSTLPETPGGVDAMKMSKHDWAAHQQKNKMNRSPSALG